jgi:iron complex transport system substrate-binding protein
MMKRKFSLILLAGLIMVVAGCSANANPSVESEDADGDRIIATTVAVTEIMDALEIDLVAVPTSYKDLPKRYDGLTEIGNPMNPDMEIILSLKPTEVMSVSTLKSDLDEVFSGRNINTSYLNLQTLENMQNEILALGERYDRQEQAEALIQKFEEKVDEIELKTEGKEQPSVLILMGVPGSYLVATENSYLGDLVKRAGGKNVISGESVEFLSSNTEYLQKSNPDIILRAAHGMPKEVVNMFDKEFKENDIWKHFNAVKNDRVYDLEETLFGTTGNLAATEALDELLEMLYN